MIVLKALAKDPERRYQTADEMRTDLDDAGHGRSVAALAEAATQIVPPASRAERPSGIAARVAGLAPISAFLLGPLRLSRKASPTAGWVAAPRARFALLIAALLAVGLALGVWGRAASVAVEVPDVRGIAPAQAESVLANVGLRVAVAGELLSPEVPRGLIISQRPEASARADRGEAVQVAVSLGPGVAVPDLSGRTEAEVRTRLRGAGLALGTVERGPADQKSAGRVLAQDPAPGTVVAGDSQVNIVLGVDPPPRQEQNQGPGRGRNGRGRRD